MTGIQKKKESFTRSTSVKIHNSLNNVTVKKLRLNAPKVVKRSASLWNE